MNRLFSINEDRSIDRSTKDQQSTICSLYICRKLLIIITTLIEYCALHSFLIRIHYWNVNLNLNLNLKRGNESISELSIINFQSTINTWGILWDTLHWAPWDHWIDWGTDVVFLDTAVNEVPSCSQRYSQRTCCCPFMLPQRDQFMHESNF